MALKPVPQTEINVLVLERLWAMVKFGLVGAYPPAIMFYIGSAKKDGAITPMTLDDLKNYFALNVPGSTPIQLDSWYDNQGRQMLEGLRVDAIVLDGIEYRKPVAFYLADLIDVFEAANLPDFKRRTMYHRCEGFKNSVAAWRIRLA